MKRPTLKVKDLRTHTHKFSLILTMTNVSKACSQKNSNYCGRTKKITAVLPSPVDLTHVKSGRISRKMNGIKNLFF